MAENEPYQRFIETPFFSVYDINNASAKEKQGGGQPPYWEMVFWWTRKQLAGARAVAARALLPVDTNQLTSSVIYVSSSA